MALPLYLAMGPEEMAAASPLPRHPGVFLPAEGALPPGTMAILDDRLPFRFDPARIAGAAEAAGVLLDFERKPDGDSADTANALFQALSCPVAAPPGFVDDPACAVFLPPCPLHVPLAEYLLPWQGREVWLDVTMQQQTVTVTPSGTRYGPVTPADRQEGGWFDAVLLCRCISEISADAVRFTLFDTPQTLKQKLSRAETLGVSRAVGLYQELGGKF